MKMREREGRFFFFIDSLFQKNSKRIKKTPPHLDPVKIRVLHREHPGVREQLLREVVDQLAVHEGVDAVSCGKKKRFLFFWKRREFGVELFFF